MSPYSPPAEAIGLLIVFLAALSVFAVVMSSIIRETGRKTHRANSNPHPYPGDASRPTPTPPPPTPTPKA